MSEDEVNSEQNALKQVDSNFRCLTVTTRTSSSVVLKWSYENKEQVEDSANKEFVFKLLKLQSRDDWIASAWTRKSTCIVDNLEQNVCYSLQLLVLLEEEDEFRVVDKSEVFKVSLGPLKNLEFKFSHIFSVRFK